MGRRNWCKVQYNDRTGEIQFDIRIEREKGVGKTVGYVYISNVVLYILSRASPDTHYLLHLRDGHEIKNH